MGRGIKSMSLTPMITTILMSKKYEIKHMDALLKEQPVLKPCSCQKLGVEAGACINVSVDNNIALWGS